MPHARKQIRDAVVAALTGLGTTGNRVYPSRVHPIQKEAKPTLLVYTLSESVEADPMGRPITLNRTLVLAVEAVAKAIAGVDDVLDDIAVEVEKALGADPSIGGTVIDSQLQSIENAFAGEAEIPAGRMRMDYEIEYRTKENDATTFV